MTEESKQLVFLFFATTALKKDAGVPEPVPPTTRLPASHESFDELRESLRESEARQAFLLHLSDALRPLSDPAKVQEQAARCLGEHLAANRCQYCEALADEDTLLWGPGYEVGVVHLEGLIRISDFDASILTGPVANFPVADSFNRRVRKIDLKTGILTTFAGTALLAGALGLAAVVTAGTAGAATASARTLPPSISGPTVTCDP